MIQTFFFGYGKKKSEYLEINTIISKLVIVFQQIQTVWVNWNYSYQGQFIEFVQGQCLRTWLLLCVAGRVFSTFCVSFL